jgi:hypothetical protein
MSESETVPDRLDARYRVFLETIATLRPKRHRDCVAPEFRLKAETTGGGRLKAELQEADA